MANVVVDLNGGHEKTFTNATVKVVRKGKEAGSLLVMRNGKVHVRFSPCYWYGWRKVQ